MNWLISIQKNEHNYIMEWFTHHKNLGFDRIVVFNNSKKSYNISDPIYKEIDVSKVEVPQPGCYQEFFDKFMKLGDVVCILDGDEFLTIPTNVDKFVRAYMQDCDCLRLSWQVYGDCGNVKYEKKPILERFTNPAPIDCKYNLNLPSGITENWHTKYFVRKTWKPTTLGIHNPSITFGISRNVLGEKVDSNSPFMKPIWEKAFVKHFLTKSTEEFVSRRFNTLDACGNKVATSKVLMERYFSLNERTPEKEAIFDKVKKENKNDK